MCDIFADFLSQAKSRPNEKAVEHLGISTTYSELATMSKRVGAALHSTFDRQPKVFLAMFPSPQAYAGMIGTLMVGGTFCSIDINGPTKRNSEILHSFRPDVILCDNILPMPHYLDGKRIPIIDTSALSGDTPEIAKLNSKINKAAYVVFTSGSTGRPKGVRIARKAFSHFVRISQKYFCIRPGERWAQYSNLGYDLAIMDVFMALCHGATLVTFSAPTDRIMPARVIREKGIDIWQSVPSVLELMLADDTFDEGLRSLRVMSFCGAPLLTAHLDGLFRAHPDLVVFNTYGTTETTGFNTLNRLTVDNYKASCRGATVALGEEVPGWTIKLIGGPSPREGHIIVCGENLSLGYWEDEEKTVASFRELLVAGKRVQAYYTGDWGERVGQALYFKGRINRQVKVKGERIELDEIDYLLCEAGFPVAGSVLKDNEIYSYVEANEPIDEKVIRERLAEYLPFHALPKRILNIERMPRTQNGKIAFAELQRLTGEMR